MKPLTPAERFESDALTILEVVDAKMEDKSTKKIRALTPYESKYGMFKRLAYSLLRKTLGMEGGHNIIKSVVRQAAKEPARLYYRGNEFHWGLLAIDPEFDVLNKKTLYLFSRQLEYAGRHEVPEHFLIGFLYQSGSTDAIAKKLAGGNYEPWWTGPRRLAFPLDGSS